MKRKTGPLQGKWVLGVLLLAFGCSWQAYGQVDTGSIQGVVKDQSGAVIPGAQVTLTNQGTGFSLKTTTSNAGSYIFTPIKIGAYTVTVEKTGFQRATNSHVTVNVQQQVVVDFTLVPGMVTQTVTVSAAPPLLQTQNASVGQVVGSRQINNLPLNGRNYTFLAQLVAGVSIANQDGRGLAQSGSFSANGTRPAQNNYLLDGIDNNSNQVDFLGGTNYVALPPVDAIQEFKVQTADYSAEFGRGAGAVLNATIKSGQNQFHGDAWEFLRNSGLDAANFFENAGNLPKGEYRQNQFGFTLGGPIEIPHIYNGKDKTFFFVDYQGTRIRQATPFVENVPTALERSSGFTDFSELIKDQSGTRTDLLGRTFPLGTIFDPATTRAVTAGQVDPVTGLTATQSGFVRDPFYAGNLVGMIDFTTPGVIAALNHLPANRLDLNAIKLLNVYPNPTAAGIFSNYSANPAIRNSVDQSDIRIDHNFSDHDQIFGRVSFSINPEFTPAPFQGVADGGGFNAGYQENPTLNTVLSETHSFSPTVINEARIGVDRQGTSRVQPNANTFGIPAQFGIQGVPQVPNNGGLPEISISGLSGIGASNFLPTFEPNQTTQATENLTKVYGGHTFKGGFEFQHIKQQFFQPAWSRGHFSFDGTYTEVPNAGGGNTGMAQVLLTPMPSQVPNGFDNLGGADTVFASNIPNIDLGRNYWAGYFQDDWKVSPKLTLDLGLRYEYFDPGEENFNHFAAFRNGAPGQAQFILPAARCNEPILSSSFLAALAKDGIQKVCSSRASLIEAERTNFGPRAGLAYRLTSKLVLRTGYGLFYGPPEQPNIHAAQNYPFDIEQGFFAPDAAHSITYPTGVFASLENGMTGIPLNPLDISGVGIPLQGDQFHWLTPYTESYNVTLQYAVTPNQTVTLGYVGNQSHHLTTQPESNLVQFIAPPSLNPQNFVPFPDFQRSATYSATEGNSYYHSIQGSFERRFSNGLNFLADYTYSKCRTDARTLLTGDIGGYRAAGVPGFGIQKDYSLCDFDVPQILHFSGGYVLPIGNGHRLLGNSSGLLNQALGGWSVHWILALQDGEPFTVGCPIATTAGLGCNALLVPGQNVYACPHDVNQWMNPKAFANPAPATTISQTNFAPLGGAFTQLHGPGFHRFDFSLFKEFHTSESTRLEFRTEVFNVTNTPQFALPSFTDFTNVSSFGRITSVRDGANDPREIQFALKFYF